MIPTLLLLAVQMPVLRVTAYCDRGITASGVRAGPGMCAAPEWVPFGSILIVDGKRYVCRDRTAKRFRHNTIDIWNGSRAECLRYGVKWQRVWIENKEKRR